MNPLVIYLVVINLFAFSIAVWDKNRAVAHKFRVSENTLLLSAVLGGGAGLMLAFFMAHHKTQKKKFMIGVPMIIVIQLVIVYLAVNYLIR